MKRVCVLYAEDIFYPNKISMYEVIKDNHAIHYTSIGNFTIGCMLFISEPTKTHCSYLRS